MKRGSCKGFLFDFLLNSGVLNTVRFFYERFYGRLAVSCCIEV